MNNELMISLDMIIQIRDIMNNARFNVVQQINNEQLLAYWNIGRVIVEHEQISKKRAEYGKRTLKQLSKVLTKEFEKGFSSANLQNMRSFYLSYPNCQTLSGKLSWSHYCELLIITVPDRRSFYESANRYHSLHR